MSRVRIAERRLRRVAMVSLHTSPLAQPGTGDAGGMNVYVDSVARAMARCGVSVEVFTRAPGESGGGSVAAAPGYTVHHLESVGGSGVGKDDLPGHLCAFSAALLRRQAGLPPGWFDVVHSHYWLSGQIGWVAAQSWNTPWVHSMHTLARVKNASRAAGDSPEPASRILGEDQIAGAADLLVANTEAEADDLARLYGADPGQIRIVHPGVDLEVFRPGDRALARRELGLPPDKVVLLFVGRLQPLKAPDVLIRALAALMRRQPDLAEGLEVVICGGPSGSTALDPRSLAMLAGSLGVGHLVRFEPPAGRSRLAQLYRAADVTVVPSYNESFGLVAVESQAVGTPVLAAAVGGLRTAVAHGSSGLLVAGHDVEEWAAAIAALARSESLRDRLGSAGPLHARRFSWTATADGLLQGYLAAAAGSLAVAGAAAAG